MKPCLTMGAALALAAAFTAQSATACRVTETEPNNYDTSANTGACSGTAISGTISSSSDYDWYRIDVAAAGAINISLAHDSGIDLDWYLYKSSGSYVAYRSTASNPETGSYSASAAGAYYLRVKRYTGTGRYTLTMTYPSTGGGGGGGSTPCTLPAAVNLGKTGNATPKATTTSGGIVLMGGGMDVDEAIKWINTKSGGGDFVVLRSTGSNGYNDYIYGLGGVNSVQTLLITSRAQANDACVVQTIKNAGAVFMAGGNQADYIDYFKGQGVGNALNYLINTKRAGRRHQRRHGRAEPVLPPGRRRSDDCPARPYRSRHRQQLPGQRLTGQRGHRNPLRRARPPSTAGRLHGQHHVQLRRRVVGSARHCG